MLLLSFIGFFLGGFLGKLFLGAFLPYAFVGLAAVWGVVVVGYCCDCDFDYYD